MQTILDANIRSELLDRRERLQAAIDTVADTKQLEYLLNEVDLALDRVARGTFGLCETCHDSIESDRIKADPLIRYCIDHLSPDEQRALEQDLMLAAKVQSELLPHHNLQTPGWDICYHYEPLGPVSGDYCDLLPGEDGTLFFVLGDVSGKGVAASMLMAHLHAIFRSLANLELPLDKLVERVNRVFCESSPDTHYATLICGRALPSGEVEICNAGHCPAVVSSAAGVTTVAATGLPVGIFTSAQYGTSKIKLNPDDSIVLYTDGLSEARDEEGREYGAERLSSLLKMTRRTSTRSIVDDCVGDLRKFQKGQPAFDDMTLMAIRRTTVQ